MKKPTAKQSEVLETIRSGQPVPGAAHGWHQDLEVREFQWSRDGFDVLAHRTIRAYNTGDPRIDFRVEMYRISPEGAARRI